MTQFILRKNLNIKSFENYISPAQKTNQFANYGSAVRLLEARARKMLQVDDSKAVIANNIYFSLLGPRRQQIKFA